MNKNLAKIVGVLVLVVLIACLAGNVLSQMFVGSEQTTGTIRMVQPQGWIWSAWRDAHYAQEVNVPNSVANSNNSQAALNNARAAQVAAEAYNAQVQASDTLQSKLYAFCAGAMIPALFLVAAAGLAIFFAKKEGAI